METQFFNLFEGEETALRDAPSGRPGPSPEQRDEGSARPSWGGRCPGLHPGRDIRSVSRTGQTSDSGLLIQHHCEPRDPLAGLGEGGGLGGEGGIRMKADREPAAGVLGVAAVFLEAEAGVGAAEQVDAVGAILGLDRARHRVGVGHGVARAFSTLMESGRMLYSFVYAISESPNEHIRLEIAWSLCLRNFRVAE